MYRERPSRVDRAVVWNRTASGGETRILPDGCMDLIWSDGRLFVAGPDTRVHLMVDDPGTTYTGLRFGPGSGPTVLGVPGHALRDQRVALDAIWAPSDARRLAERVADATTPGRVLEQAVEERLRETGPPPRAMIEVARLLRIGRTVGAVADATGLSERQLRRRCLDAFGYGPKTLARVLRMNRAVELARAGVPFVDTAADSGYADQAHLAREVRALAGVSLSRLTS